MYNISVTAINDIGESAPVSINLLAASVPQKLSIPSKVTSNPTSITI